LTNFLEYFFEFVLVLPHTVNRQNMWSNKR